MPLNSLSRWDAEDVFDYLWRKRCVFNTEKAAIGRLLAAGQKAQAINILKGHFKSDMGLAIDMKVAFQSARHQVKVEEDLFHSGVSHQGDLVAWDTLGNVQKQDMAESIDYLTSESPSEAINNWVDYWSDFIDEQELYIQEFNALHDRKNKLRELRGY